MSAAVRAATAMEAAAITMSAGETMLSMEVMTGIADVALAVARFIAVEVIEGAVAASREWSVIAVVRIVAVIHVAVEAVGPMEPGSSADEDTAVEPVRPVIAIRSTVIRRVVEITVRAGRRNADTDRDLRGGRFRRDKHCSCEGGYSEWFPERHDVPFLYCQLIGWRYALARLCITL